MAKQNRKKPVKKQSKPVKKPVKKADKKKLSKSNNEILSPESEYKSRKRLRQSINLLFMSQIMIENQEDYLREEGKMLGIALAKTSKNILESLNMKIDFKIDGLDVSNLNSAFHFNLQDKLQTAIKEERYEDAQKIKEEIENQKDFNAQIENRKNEIKKENDILQLIEDIRGTIVTENVFKDFIKYSEGIISSRYRKFDENLIVVEIPNISETSVYFFVKVDNTSIKNGIWEV